MRERLRQPIPADGFDSNYEKLRSQSTQQSRRRSLWRPQSDSASVRRPPSADRDPARRALLCRRRRTGAGNRRRLGIAVGCFCGAVASRRVPVGRGGARPPHDVQSRTDMVGGTLELIVRARALIRRRGYSCPGCSYPSSCCCPPGQTKTRTVTSVVTVSKIARSSGSGSSFRVSLGSLQNEIADKTPVRLALELEEVAQAPGPRGISRHICPACVKGEAGWCCVSA